MPPKKALHRHIFFPHMHGCISCCCDCGAVIASVCLLDDTTWASADSIPCLRSDNVFANENGVRRKPWYFLMPNYWFGVGRGNVRRTNAIQTARCNDMRLLSDLMVCLRCCRWMQKNPCE